MLNHVQVYSCLKALPLAVLFACNTVAVGFAKMAPSLPLHLASEATSSEWASNAVSPVLYFPQHMGMERRCDCILEKVHFPFIES